jgi:hypothetical protein
LACAVVATSANSWLNLNQGMTNCSPNITTKKSSLPGSKNYALAVRPFQRLRNGVIGMWEFDKLSTSPSSSPTLESIPQKSDGQHQTQTGHSSDSVCTVKIVRKKIVAEPIVDEHEQKQTDQDHNNLPK